MNGSTQVIVSVQVIMTEKFFILLVSNTIIDEDQPVSIFDQQATQRPATKVVFIGRVGALPDGLGHNTKHSASIQFKIASINYMEIHVLKIRIRPTK